MSDEWKIAQGLKKQNQDLSFKFDETGNDYAYKLENAKKIKEEETMEQKWNSKNVYFNKKNEEKDIEDLKKYILYCRENNKEIIVNRGNLSFEIDDNNPSDITFKKENKKEGSNIANIKNGEVTYSEIELREERYAHYWGSDKIRIGLSLVRSIYVINGNEINEYYSFNPQYNGELSSESKEIVANYFVNENPEYSKGAPGEVFREEINPNEHMKNYLQDEDVLRQYIIPGTRNKLGKHPSGLYVDRKEFEVNERLVGLTHYFLGDFESEKYKQEVINFTTFDDYSIYLKDAKEFEERCKYVYSVIGKAYEALGEKDKFFVDDKEMGKDEGKNEITQEETNLESLSDEELDKFIETENNKQKENQQKIERLKKIKKAKELIALSKQQDREISELESQIRNEGMEFDE